MFRKEIKDTLKLSVGAILVFLITLIFSFTVIRLVVDESFPIGEFVPGAIYITMMVIAFYLGISLFAEEKNEKTFEYLFSLKYSRLNILIYKLVPRIVALLFFLGSYALLSAILEPFPVPAGWFITIFLYFSLFLSSSAMSQLHRNHINNIVYALAIYLTVYGVFVLFIIQIKESLYIQANPKHISIFVFFIFIFSLLIFLAFIQHFRKADLSNLTRVFSRSLFSFLKFIGFPLLGLFLIWIIINRFDSAKIQPEFSLLQLKPTNFEKTNGFYRLWTLSEGPNVNVESDKTMLKYRHLFDPQFDNEKYIKSWNQDLYRKTYSQYTKRRRTILQGHQNKLDYNFEYPTDLVKEIEKIRAPIQKLKKESFVFIQRYQKLVECEIFMDLTLPNIWSPVPNLLAWMHISKLYDWLCVLEAKDGNWDSAFNRLFDHINFEKMVFKKTRVLLINLVAKQAMQHSLWILASLLNQPECPRETYQKVLDRLKPITIKEAGTQVALQADYLALADSIQKKNYLEGDTILGKLLSALFFQKNRTKRYFLKPYKNIINLEKQPPYQWSRGIIEFRSKYSRKKRGWFWWLVNPGGKIVAQHTAIPNLLYSVQRTFHTITLVDMIRILAEINLHHQSGESIKKTLDELESYKTLDPCSGKPYIWNEKKQILYSIGVDRDDDQGNFNPRSLDTDYVLPVRLVKKE